MCAEKAMAPHSSTPAWKIPWTEEPGRLQSMGSLRVRHYWVTSLWLFTFMHWRRKWQPTPVLLPGKSHGWRNLVGCHLCGCRVRHDWSDLAAVAAACNAGDEGSQVHSQGWEDPLEKEMATPLIFLPGKSPGQRSLAAYSPWDHKSWTWFGD